MSPRRASLRSSGSPRAIRCGSGFGAENLDLRVSRRRCPAERQGEPYRAEARATSGFEYASQPAAPRAMSARRTDRFSPRASTARSNSYRSALRAARRIASLRKATDVVRSSGLAAQELDGTDERVVELRVRPLDPQGDRLPGPPTRPAGRRSSGGRRTGKADEVADQPEGPDQGRAAGSGGRGRRARRGATRSGRRATTRPGGRRPGEAARPRRRAGGSGRPRGWAAAGGGSGASRLPVGRGRQRHYNSRHFLRITHSAVNKPRTRANRAGLFHKASGSTGWSRATRGPAGSSSGTLSARSSG